jgi:K+-sensing histidine kinase KdpD
LKLTATIQSKFSQYISTFLKPFQVKLNSKNVNIELDTQLNDGDLCTDWKIYEGIMYHLMANAVKYSPPNSEIQLTFEK